MRFKLTLFLFALNVIAFGAIYYLERDGGNEPIRENPEPILPSSITQSDRIEIAGETIPTPRVLIRKGETWQLQKPVEWRANPNAIDRIFRSLLFLRQEIRFTLEDVERNNQTLADYGLENPVLKLIFDKGDQSTEISVGSPTDVGGRFYLLGPSGEEIFVVDEEILRSVALDIQDLTDRNLFSLDFFAVKEMTLQPGNGRNLQIRLAAIDDGWRFEAPIQTAASSAAVDSRLQALLETPVGTLYAESSLSPSETGLVEPRFRISLDDGNRRQTFLLGSPIPGSEDRSYGKLEGVPTVVTVPEEAFLALEDAQRTMRERSFFQFRLSDVNEVRIVSPSRKISLQRLEDNNSWQVSSIVEGEEPVRYPADPDVLTKTFESLITLRAVRFVSDAPSDSDLADYGLDDPQRRVLLAGETSNELLLGNLDPETKTLYAKVAGQPFVYAVPLDIIRDLPVSALAYRYRLLDALPETARVKSVRVTNLESGEILMDRAIGDDGQSWESEAEGEDAAEKNGAFAIILRQIRDFRVASYFSSTFGNGLRIEPDRLIPWSYELSAVIELPGSGDATEIIRKYSLTERIGGTLQGGGFEPEEVTFLLPQIFIDAWAILFPERELPEIYEEEAATEAATETPENAPDTPAEPSPESSAPKSPAPEESAAPEATSPPSKPSIETDEADPPPPDESAETPPS